MEALCTKLNILLWEINGLDVENRRLSSDNHETSARSARVDLEAELERAKGDVASLTERVRVYEQQLAQIGETATEYQQKLAELENQM